MPGVFRYREIRPSPRLSHFVSSLWLLEDDDASAVPQRIVPDGHAELILNWGEPYQHLANGEWQSQPRLFFAGQIDGPLMLKPGGRTKMLGIGFHPHGASCLFRHPMQELAGSFTPLEDLSRAFSRQVDEALQTHDPVAAIETALWSAQEHSRSDRALVGEAVRLITATNGGADLARLARHLGLSLRQLERRFLAAVGLQPKRFSRIHRFSHVFHALEQHPGDWVETALACGYYDQAHLIRDCKALSGQTPATLLAEDADLARHFYQRLSHSSNTSRHHSR
jgi:AraC-like DNA-binding protein